MSVLTDNLALKTVLITVYIALNGDNDITGLSNPQYILAKSSSQVPVIRCNETTTQLATDNPSYARAPLKACLAVICDSSPELLQDPTRDYSLYVLDPLESQPMPVGLASPSQSANSPRGVAVALGLMSWALESNHSTSNVLITGTIIPNTSLALEVVCALRETKRMPKPMLHPYPSFGSISQSLNPSLPPQAQRTLTRSADFPELYIGPPRRAPGRPEGSTSSKSRVSASSNTKGNESQSESKGQVGKRPKQKAKLRSSRAPPTYSPFICAPLNRNAATGTISDATSMPVFSPQSHPSNQIQAQPHVQFHPHIPHCNHPTNNPLLGLLSTISGSNAVNPTPEQQATLLSALQGFLSTNPHLLRLAATNAENSAVGGETKSSNADEEHDSSDIVVLDSSAVDTAAFRKSSTTLRTISNHSKPTLTTNQRPPISSNQSIDSSPLPASTPASSQAFTQVSTPTLVPEAETPTSKRVVSRCIQSGGLTASHAMAMPATPTPARTRKRKLNEYSQGQLHSSPPLFPPSPSPSMSRIFNSGKALVAKQMVHSSPTSRTNSALSPPARLPSMLGAMRAVTASGPRSQVGSTTTLVSGSFKSKGDNTPSNTTASETTSLKRRRTLNLNEFMAEHEARKNTKVRKHSSLGHKLNLDTSTNASQALPSRYNKFESTSRHAQSSPPRPLFRSGPVVSALSPPASTFQTGLMPGNFVCNPTTSPAAFASPGSPTLTSTTAPVKNPLKSFVMPAWARTSTAMLPRLSEEALARQRAEREAKKAQVALRRREAAKAKRRRADGGNPPLKDSSDEDDEPVATRNAVSQTLHPPTGGLPSAPSLLSSPPALPVFASDAVEFILSSPPRSHRQLAALAPPSTPPRKYATSGLGPHHSPDKSGSGSLFTPLGHDASSLFTPSTPSITRSLTRAAFTPRSPTVLRSGTNGSPQKGVSGTHWTPRHHSGGHSTPRGLCLGENPQITSPGTVTRTPQTQTGMVPRPFLLPPPSPCAPRTPLVRTQVQSKVSGSSIPLAQNEVVSPSPSQTQRINKVREEDRLSRELEDVLLGRDASTHPDQGTDDLADIASVEDTVSAEEDYLSSPLPPSSPLPISPFSSPAKLHGASSDPETANNIAAPGSDLFLPSSSDPEPAWLSDDHDAAAAAVWFTDSETNSWLTETEAWLTDSDGAWLSDSDAAAAFGDMSTLPPSSLTNWFSDDVDVDTDREGLEDRFGAAAFQRALATLVECRGRAADGHGHGGGGGEGGTQAAGGVAHDPVVVDPGFWEAMQLPAVLGGDGTSVSGDGAVDEMSVKQEDIRALLDGLENDTT